MTRKAFLLFLLLSAAAAHGTGLIEDGIDILPDFVDETVEVTMQVFDEIFVDPLEEAFFDPIERIYELVPRSLVEGMAALLIKSRRWTPCDQCFLGRVKHFRESFDSIRYIIVSDEQERMQLIRKTGIGEFALIAADPVEEVGPDGAAVETATFWLAFVPPQEITTEEFIFSGFRLRANVWIHTVWDLQGDLPGSESLVYRPLPLDGSAPMRQQAVLLHVEDGYSYEIVRLADEGFPPTLMEYPSGGQPDLREDPDREVPLVTIVVSRDK